MSISLNRLCVNAQKKYAMKLLAGKYGLENPVRWVHMVEDTEVPDFLHGNELVFTTGIANHKENWLIDFVKNLKEKKSSGLVINIGPYISHVPPQVIVYCEQNNFPLFVVPWETRLIDLTYEFCRIIINDEKVEQSLAETFKNLILNPENKTGYTTTLEKLGFIQNSKYTVISLKFLLNGSNVSSKLLREIQLAFVKTTKLNALPRGAFVWNKSMILVYQNIEEKDILRLKNSIKNHAQTTCGLKIYMGVSNAIHGYEKLGKIYNQSKSALCIAQINNKTRVNYDDIGVYKLLFNVQDKEVLTQYHNFVLGKLIKYDKANNTDFCTILRQYMDNNGSVQELAKINNTHRNTINYKIKKVKEIMGIDFDIKSNMDISLAFIISDIINKK